MLTRIWSSRTHRHCLNFIKPRPLSIIRTHILHTTHIKLLPHDQTSKLYHSTARAPKNPEFFIPREDYSHKQDVAKANHTVTRLCKEGKIREAREMFEQMPERDVISWTALISGHVKCGLLEEARVFFDRADAVKNVVTWTAMMSGYAKAGKVSEARKLFDEMPDRNVVAWNTMIDGYVRCGSLECAIDLFGKMGERNIASWNTIISGLMKFGKIEEAHELFRQMPARNVVSWTIMVSGLAGDGKVDEARSLFDLMPDRNVVSWNAMINGYIQNMRLVEAYNLFDTMPEKDVKSWNTMMAGFIRNGELERALWLFHEIPHKNVVSWTTIISGFVQNGKNEEALRIFCSMMRDRMVIKPNEVTFATVLCACGNLAGLNEGAQVHQVISKIIYHQESEFVVSALINMYSKCGDLKMARRAFDDKLKGHQDLVSWNSMIAAYAQHGCGYEAISIFEEMRKTGFDPNDVTYVGLLNACSHAGLVQEGLNYFNALLEDGSVRVRDDHYTCVVDLYGRAGRLKEAYDLITGLSCLKDLAYAWGALLLGCNVHGEREIGKLAAKRLLDLEPENANAYVLLSNVYSVGGGWNEAEVVKSRMKGRGLKKQPGCSWIEVRNELRVFVVGDRSSLDGECGDDIHLLLWGLHEKMRKVEDLVLENVVMEENFL
ncbi:Pentatricopeptide repeat-containing protein -mitochondrial [Striga hermonthica]|uniref:Pentatricopeptide repeat-containing protein -mitochondrial n=1 Tax=Striga hermonthica TaxID=68872 RepID=A0A9N7MKF0_STRHE|nr:Pentatricopeptide repeat-containing protein -mitochondrial [Striga hermonthica]